MATVLTRRREKTGPACGERPLVACLAGNPNVGKSSLFNALTGARSKRLCEKRLHLRFVPEGVHLGLGEVGARL